MTPERAEEIVASLQRYRDIGEAMDIPAMYAEMQAQRGWLAIGYDSWDELMEMRLGGWRLSLPRTERADAVAAMRGAGMPQRAIAAALGVGDATVRRDLDSGAPYDAPDRVLGRDGKSYPAKVTTTTRTTEATKIERAVDMSTGEILGGEVTAEQWEADNPEFAPGPSAAEVAAAVIDADPDVQDARYRANVSRSVVGVVDITKFDPARVATLLDADGWMSLDLAMRQLREWHQSVARHRNPLRLIGGSK